MDMSKKNFVSKIKEYSLPVAFVLSLLLIWELIVFVFNIKEFILPAPSGIVGSMVRGAPTLISNTVITLNEILIGFALAIVLGLVFGIAIAYSKLLSRMLYPVLVFTQAVPKVAIAPAFLIWFGYGIMPKILMTFLISFFPIVVDTAAGLMMIEPELIDLVRSLKATGMQIFTKIRFPNALPHIFSGLKVAAPLAVVGAIVAEFVGTNNGLGYIILLAEAHVDTTLVLACAFILAVLGIALFAVVIGVERLVLPWRSAEEEEVRARSSL